MSGGRRRSTTLREYKITASAGLWLSLAVVPPIFRKGTNIMAKRGHGEGTVFERKDRPGVWRAEFSYADPVTGQTKRKKFERAGRKEALTAGKEWIKQVEGGLLPDADKLTLGEWIDRWLEDYAKPKLRVKSYDKYEGCLRLYVKPYLGKVAIIKLKSPDVQKLFNKLMVDGGQPEIQTIAGKEQVTRKGLSSVTVRITRRYLCMCLDQAVKVGLITRNVAKDTDPPKLVKKEIKALTQEQAAALTEATKDFGEITHVAIQIALGTGMRLGEIFGLKWDCVDLKEGNIQVKRALVTNKAGQLFQEPKTASSRRKIPITTDLIKELRKYKKWQEWQRHLMGDKWQDNDLVLANTIGKVISTTTFTSACFKPALEKAGISRETRFHDLRHTHATLLLAQGISAKIVQERLGHANISMTLDTYSHVTPDMQRAAVDALEGLFTKAK